MSHARARVHQAEHSVTATYVAVKFFGQKRDPSEQESPRRTCMLMHSERSAGVAGVADDVAAVSVATGAVDAAAAATVSVMGFGARRGSTAALRVSTACRMDGCIRAKSQCASWPVTCGCGMWWHVVAYGVCRVACSPCACGVSCNMWHVARGMRLVECDMCMPRILMRTRPLTQRVP